MLFPRMLYPRDGGNLWKETNRSAPTKHAGPFHHSLDINAECFELQRNTADRVAVVNRHDKAGQLVRLIRALRCWSIHSTGDNASGSLNQALPDVYGALASERLAGCDKLIP